MVGGGMLVLSWRQWSKPYRILWPGCSAQLDFESSVHHFAGSKRTYLESENVDSDSVGEDFYFIRI